MVHIFSTFHSNCWTSWLYICHSFFLLFGAGESAELSTDPNEEDIDDAKKMSDDGKTVHCDDHLTPAERRYIEQREQIDVHRLAKVANKSHRDRIQDFNQYLANMSEHYDIPKVGPGWFRQVYEYEEGSTLHVSAMYTMWFLSTVFFIWSFVLYGRWFSVWWFLSVLELDYKLLSMKFAFARKTHIYSHLNMVISAWLSSVPALGFPQVPSTS